MELKAKAKRWGSSIGVIIPKEIVEAKQIRENDIITIEIKKELLFVRDVFGMLKNKIHKPTQEIKDEMREGWESESDRKRNARWKM